MNLLTHSRVVYDHTPWHAYSYTIMSFLSVHTLGGVPLISMASVVQIIMYAYLRNATRFDVLANPGDSTLLLAQSLDCLNPRFAPVGPCSTYWRIHASFSSLCGLPESTLCPRRSMVCAICGMSGQSTDCCAKC